MSYAIAKFLCEYKSILKSDDLKLLQNVQKNLHILYSKHYLLNCTNIETDCSDDSECLCNLSTITVDIMKAKEIMDYYQDIINALINICN